MKPDKVGSLPETGESLRTVTSVRPEQKLYPVSKLAVLVNSLRREGFTASQALRGAHLVERDLHDPRVRVSQNQILCVCRNAAALSHDPHFAHHAGSRVHLSTYGMYGFAILSSTDLRRGIGFALRYHQLAVPLVDVSWREERGRSVWTLLPIATLQLDAPLLRFVVEFELTILISLHRDCIGSSFSPQTIELPFAPPYDVQIYADMFGCPVLFDRPSARLIFDAKWLDREAPFANDIAHAELVSLCDGLLEEFHLRVGIAGRVREILLHKGMSPTGIAEVARHLHMTDRTLRRRLKDEKTSFRKILAELRMRMAAKYLRETDLSIREIAYSLGFSEEGSFRQAFRRWSAVAPRRFRGHIRNRRRPARGGLSASLRSWPN